MSNWKTYKLGDIAQIIGGGTPSTTKEEYWNGEIGWLTPRDLTGYSFKYISKGERNITEKGLKNSSARLMPEGTVLMTSRAPIGYLAIAGHQLCTNQGFKSFIVDEDKINNEYLYYLLRNNIDRIKSLGTGSTFAEVSASILKSFEIEIPDLPTQRQIAQILTSLDDKIELNLQMNQTLEAMAQAIFKEWFVNFNFPGFDGELVDGLPKGWRMGKLGEICDIKIGRTPPRMETEWFSLNDKDVKWISIKDMGQAGVYLFNTYEYLTKEAIEKFRIPVIPKNTVVISFKLTVGRVSITTETMLSNEAIAQLNTDIFSTEYLYCYLKTYNWGSLGSTSSIATAINSKSIKEMEVLIPDFRVIKEFTEVVISIFEKIKYNSLQIQSLTQIRDTLLPKLMSGALEVKSEEWKVESEK
jgi:type I restriction enzyme S subunit